MKSSCPAVIAAILAADSRPATLTIVAQVVTADIDPALLQQDGDTVYAVLTGSTSGGEAIEGEDEITIVPPK